MTICLSISLPNYFSLIPPLALSSRISDQWTRQQFKLPKTCQQRNGFSNCLCAARPRPLEWITNFSSFSSVWPACLIDSRELRLFCAKAIVRKTFSVDKSFLMKEDVGQRQRWTHRCRRWAFPTQVSFVNLAPRFSLSVSLCFHKIIEIKSFLSCRRVMGAQCPSWVETPTPKQSRQRGKVCNLNVTLKTPRWWCNRSWRSDRQARSIVCCRLLYSK